MTVVVDLGCFDREGACSPDALVVEYAPTRIYGFDPCPEMEEGTTLVDSVPVTVKRTAAWLYDGTINYREDGSRSRVYDGDLTVPCFDFPTWLAALLDEGEPVALKMDVEGAETVLVPAMIANGTAVRLQELLIEWHGTYADGMEATIPCPVRRWWM